MKKSENFGFSLPENSDNCSLDYFNDNFKLIDKNLKQALNPPSSIVLDSIEIKNNNGGTIITCDGMRYYERNYDFEDLVLGTDSLNSNSKYYIKAINIQNPTSEQFGILSANLAVCEYEGEIKSVDDSFIFATFETDVNALYVEDSLRYFPDSHIYEKINTKADKSYVNNKTAFSLGVPGFYGADNVLIKTFDKMIADGDITVSGGILTAVSITEQGKLIISDDITELATGIFSNESLLIGVKIPDTVTTIPSGAFFSTSLTSVIIPDSVTSIGNAAFGSCKSLKSVTLGKGVTHISDGAFDNCNSLTDVYFKGSKTEFDKIEIGTSNEYLKNAVIHYELTNEVYDEIDRNASDIEPLNKSVFGDRQLLAATPIDTDWAGYMDESGEIYGQDKTDRWHKTYKLCDEDETIKVFDYAGGNILHCIFLDNSENVISTTTGGWTGKYLDIEVPSSSKFVVVNSTDVDKIVCYTHIYDTSYNVNQKILDVFKSVNSMNGTIDAFGDTLKTATDTLFAEKKYISLDVVDETYKVLNNGVIGTSGASKSYTVYKYTGQTLKAKGYHGGIVPLAVFFDFDGNFLSYAYGDVQWSNTYQDIVIPENAYKVYINDNDAKFEIDLQALQFEAYNVKSELERIERLIPDTPTIKYDLQNAQLQLAKTQRMNDFDYNPFDKAYFVLTIDDANMYLPVVYDLCHELGIKLCPAIITGNLNTDYKNDGRTIKDICDLVVADGGEILAHSEKYITAESTEQDYIDVFRTPKQTLENLGYTVRGIITAGGANYLENDVRVDNWSRKYYDYSDRNGLNTSKAYWKPRWWHHDYTMAQCKTYVDNAVANKTFTVMAMHGTDDTSDLEYIDHLRELLEYMIEKGTDKLEFVTWAYVYDTFGTTKLEKRIKALENA